MPVDIQLGRNVVVKDGEIVSVSNVSLSEPVNSSDIETFDKMLNAVYYCPLLFPLLVCSCKYDSSFGYLTEMTVNCPIPDVCYEKTVIENVEILPP